MLMDTVNHSFLGDSCFYAHYPCLNFVNLRKTTCFYYTADEGIFAPVMDPQFFDKVCLILASIFYIFVWRLSTKNTTSL